MFDTRMFLPCVPNHSFTILRGCDCVTVDVMFCDIYRVHDRRGTCIIKFFNFDGTKRAVRKMDGLLRKTVRRVC